MGNGLRYGTRLRVALHGDDAQVPARDDRRRRRQSGGVGLALFIARELVRRQGGQLRLANRSEGGLRAEVTLPRHGL